MYPVCPQVTILLSHLFECCDYRSASPDLASELDFLLQIPQFTLCKKTEYTLLTFLAELYRPVFYYLCSKHAMLKEENI